MDRRKLLKSAVSVSAILAPSWLLACTQGEDEHPCCADEINSFDQASNSKFIVRDGYSADLLIAWRDPINGIHPGFEATQQSPGDQARQFGYNPQGCVFLPINRDADAQQEQRALLVVNHQYASPKRMFASFTSESTARRQIRRSEIRNAATFSSIVEIEREKSGRWHLTKNSTRSRRLTTDNTFFEFTGPAAKHCRMKTEEFQSGENCLGAIAVTAASKTPWGTVLLTEEKTNFYFYGTFPERERCNYLRTGIKEKRVSRFLLPDTRFDLTVTPNGANHYGWVLEIDPGCAEAQPLKHTALGRFAHNSAVCALCPDGRVAVYLTDDDKKGYIYRFVSDERLPHHKNRSLKDSPLKKGTLSVAKVEGDCIVWERISQNGKRAGDCMIDARLEADDKSASPFFRPQGVLVDEARGNVLVFVTGGACENEPSDEPRCEEGKSPTNNDPIECCTVDENKAGCILALYPPPTDEGLDHSADTMPFSVIFEAGFGDEADSPLFLNSETKTSDSPQARPPDGVQKHPLEPEFGVLDRAGRIWVSAEHKEDTTAPTCTLDTGKLIVLSETNENRWERNLFAVSPKGAEFGGPTFSDDYTTLFVPVQGVGRGDLFDEMAEGIEGSWPDFKPDMPPRPAIVAIYKNDGGTLMGDGNIRN